MPLMGAASPRMSRRFYGVVCQFIDLPNSDKDSLKSVWFYVSLDISHINSLIYLDEK